MWLISYSFYNWVIWCRKYEVYLGNFWWALLFSPHSGILYSIYAVYFEYISQRVNYKNTVVVYTEYILMGLPFLMSFRYTEQYICSIFWTLLAMIVLWKYCRGIHRLYFDGPYVSHRTEVYFAVNMQYILDTSNSGDTIEILEWYTLSIFWWALLFSSHSGILYSIYAVYFGYVSQWVYYENTAVVYTEYILMDFPIFLQLRYTLQYICSIFWILTFLIALQYTLQ